MTTATEVESPPSLDGGGVMVPELTCEAVWVAGRRGRPGVWSLTTSGCPFCLKRHHTHGGQSGPHPIGGHRVAHCARPLCDKSAGYILVVVRQIGPKPLPAKPAPGGAGQ